MLDIKSFDETREDVWSLGVIYLLRGRLSFHCEGAEETFKLHQVKKAHRLSYNLESRNAVPAD